MTNEEALNLTTKSLEELHIVPEQENISYMIKVKKALEKQIPKRPKEGSGMMFCGNCGNWFDETYDVPFCPSCGQAQDWRKE